MKCPNCQSDVPADARFCGECGQAMRQLGKSLVEESFSPGPDLSGLRTIDDMETKTPRGESQRLMQPGEVFAAVTKSCRLSARAAWAWSIARMTS